MDAVSALPASALRPGRARRRRRELAVEVVLLGAAAVLLCVSVSIGDYPVRVVDVPAAVLGLGDATSAFIVQELRLPRAIVGLLAGLAFGVSGAVFQSLARNPLASPDIIGVTAGASAAAVFAIVWLGGTATLVSTSAFVGGLLAALVVYVLAYRQGMSSYRLVLVGIGIGAMLAAVTDYLMTRADIYQAQQAAAWLVGSLNAVGWDQVRPLAVVVLVGVPAALGLGRGLRALQLGDDSARALGYRVEGVKLALVVTGVALAAGATAAAGPIVFVAFMSPPIARQLTRSPGPAFVASGLFGAVLVTVADVVARRLPGVDLPVGVITGILGAPYLLYLMARANKVGRGG